jgi:hypothetical protein
MGCRLASQNKMLSKLPKGSVISSRMNFCESSPSKVRFQGEELLIASLRKNLEIFQQNPFRIGEILILDLDQTLLHSSGDPNLIQMSEKMVLTNGLTKIGTEKQQLSMWVRPFVKEFLDTTKCAFDRTVVLTLSEAKHANRVVKLLNEISPGSIQACYSGSQFLGEDKGLQLLHGKPEEIPKNPKTSVRVLDDRWFPEYDNYHFVKASRWNPYDYIDPSKRLHSCFKGLGIEEYKIFDDYLLLLANHWIHPKKSHQVFSLSPFDPFGCDDFDE